MITEILILNLTFTRPVQSSSPGSTWFSSDKSTEMTGIHLSQSILFVILYQNIGLNAVAGGCLSGEVTRDPADCSVFSQCDKEGGAHTFHCPAGLVFNEQQKVCDWPDNVNCTTSSTVR